MNQRANSDRAAVCRRLRPWAWPVAALLAASSWGCSSDSAPYQIVNQAKVEEIRDALGGAGGTDNGGGASAEQPTGFATWSGRITLTGTPPANPPLVMDKEREICAPGGQQVRDTSPVILTGDDGGLENVLIFLDTKIPDDPAWLHESARPIPGSMVEFDQEHCMFDVRMFAFETEQTLRILNSDPTGHNTKGSPSANRTFNINLSAHGHSDVDPFTKSERAPFEVACSIHPWMKAYMICRDNGYFAVTDENGNFSIPNLPTDVDLEFKIWHEACEFRLSSVEIDGAETALGRGGKLPLRLSVDEPEHRVEMVIQAEQLSE